jgi:O-antigen/teichoic acid export membrane protein
LADTHSLRKSLILSIVDHGCLSAFSLLINLFLLRTWGPEQFGAYSLTITLSFVALSVQSCIAGVVGVLRPLAKSPEAESRLMSTLWTANCIFVATLVCIVGVGFHLATPQEQIDALAPSLYIGATLLREYVRVYLFSQTRTASVLAMDLSFIALASTVVGLFWAMDGDMTVSAILVALALASGAALLPAILAKPTHFAFMFDAAARRQLRSIWHENSRWILVGSLVYEVISRAHVFVLSTFFGLAALGVIQAGAFVLRPLDLMMEAWRRVALPRFADLSARTDVGSAKRLARMCVLGSLCLTALYFPLIWLAWPYLEAHLFRGQYPDIGQIVALWCVPTVIRLIGEIYSVELQGFRRYRQLTMTLLVGSAATLAGLGLAVLTGQAQLVIVAIALGYLVDLALMLFIASTLGRTTPDSQDSPMARKDVASDSLGN